MGVPGETTDGGRSLSTLSRRPLAAVLLVLVVSVLAYLYGPVPAPNVPQPIGRDCVELHLYSNGFHSDIGAPASIFPPDHPFRSQSYAAVNGDWESGRYELLMQIDFASDRTS